MFIFHGLTWRAAHNRHDSPSLVCAQVFGLGTFIARYTPIMPSKHRVLMRVFNDGSCGFVLVTFTKPAMKIPVIYCSSTHFGNFTLPTIYTYSFYTVSYKPIYGWEYTCLASSLWLMLSCGAWCSAYPPYLVS